jgi:DNA invertase Pin-like site-specific DNA recombinase
MPKPGKPHAGKWVAYYRVSTDRQGESGLGLEAQRRAVADYLNGGSWTLAAEYTEVESGKRSDNRPQLTAALAACKRLKAKLIVAKLDRLSRNVGFICALLNSGVEFVAADMPHANKMTLQVLAVFAEHERDLISARTKQALAAAKERGVQLGGPKRAEASALGAAANRANAERFAASRPPGARTMKRLCTIILLQASASLFACEAVSQMKIDVPADTVRKLANITYLEDLSVNDTALIYQTVCVENGGLFVPSWTVPSDLAKSEYKQTGLLLSHPGASRQET